MVLQFAKPLIFLANYHISLLPFFFFHLSLYQFDLCWHGGRCSLISIMLLQTSTEAEIMISFVLIRKSSFCVRGRKNVFRRERTVCISVLACLDSDSTQTWQENRSLVCLADMFGRIGKE